LYIWPLFTHFWGLFLKFLKFKKTRFLKKSFFPNQERNGKKFFLIIFGIQSCAYECNPPPPFSAELRGLGTTDHDCQWLDMTWRKVLAKSSEKKGLYGTFHDCPWRTEINGLYTTLHEFSWRQIKIIQKIDELKLKYSKSFVFDQLPLPWPNFVMVFQGFWNFFSPFLKLI
jgi:hypothetical protein